MLPPIFERIKTDQHFRIKAFLCLSLFFNTVYSIFLFVIGQVYSSKWFFVMSIYYGLLSLIRLFIFTQINPNRKLHAKIVAMLICGCFLLLINLVISTLMFILIFGNTPVKHHEITVIAIATYTFYSLSIAIIGSVNHLKKENHVYICAKMVSLISASVSLTTLTNTMLVTFGDNTLTLRNIILPLLCGAVSLFIIISAVLMIRKAVLDLRNSKYEER